MTDAHLSYPYPTVHLGGQHFIGGLSRVYHCNHYNAYLQMTVLMALGSAARLHPECLLADAVTPLVQYLRKQGYSERELVEEFAYCGFGILRQTDAETWETPSSHYGEAVYTHGKPRKVCYFTSGYLQGLLNQQVIEVECQALGANADQFSSLGTPLNAPDYLHYPMQLQETVPARFDFPECQAFKTRVDETKIMRILRTMPLFGRNGPDETGLIDAFGVVLTNHFADYYNRISYEAYFALRDAGIPDEDSKDMFIQAGHICAFYTFGGIMSSPEWYEVVQPMCETREDWIHGMIAVINTLGWGVFRVEAIVPDKQLIVRTYNSYEGVGYRRMYPISKDRRLSFLGMGCLLGLVHLLWKIDIRTRPTLNHEFYVAQFNDLANRFRVEQTHAIAAGDAYDRFIVS